MEMVSSLVTQRTLFADIVQWLCIYFDIVLCVFKYSFVKHFLACFEFWTLLFGQVFVRNFNILDFYHFAVCVYIYTHSWKILKLVTFNWLLHIIVASKLE